MTKERRDIFGFTLGVAHGNPHAVKTAIDAIATNADYTYYSQAPVTRAMLYPIHRSIRTFDRFSKSYTEKSEDLRSGTPGLLIGLLSWIENFATNPLLLEKPKHPRVLLVTQEHQLVPFTLMPNLLIHMFPNPQRYLLIPDPIPKKSAVTILTQLEGLVTPIVLTSTAAAIMKKAGLNPTIAKSWLVPPSQKNEISWGGQPQVAIKTSGNGAKINFLNDLLTHCQLEYPSHAIAVSTPQYTTYIKQDHRWTQPHHNLGSAYAPIFDYRTNIVFSPASEVLAISAELIRQGRLKAHHTFMLSGHHERTNLEWGIKFGVTSELGYSSSSHDPVSLERELGSISLADSIS